MKNLGSKTFKIIKLYKKSMNYSARSWNRQSVQKFLLAYDEERIIECMLILHYQNEEVRDLTIELSNMYNCVVGCRFCASGNLRKSVIQLEEEDYVAQINTCLKNSRINPREYTNFYVSFYGIGEPSVVYEKIGNAMLNIKEYYPHVRFNIATFGFNYKCFDFWKQFCPDIRTLQIPFYSSRPEVLKSIVQNLPNNYDFIYVLKKALEYKEVYNTCRVKVNYIVIQDINDGNQEIEEFVNLLYPYLHSICIRISYLNYTSIGTSNGFCPAPSDKIEEIYNELSHRGFQCYIFGSERNVKVGCGQLLQDYILTKETGRCEDPQYIRIMDSD